MQLLERNVNTVFQQYALFPHMSGDLPVQFRPAEASPFARNHTVFRLAGFKSRWMTPAS